MKVLLSTLNSKYIHSNLAIRYLKAFSSYENIEVAEYSINDNINNIVADIFLKEADIIAFSCYIWNVDFTLKVISTLKKADNKLKIILGGPEVSYNPEEFMKKYLDIDFIVYGEGEITFDQLINKLSGNDNSYYDIDGVVFRDKGEIIVNQIRKLLDNLDVIKYPYQGEDITGKMVYYESSRGCPFNCQYCLSSTIDGVRYFSIDRVKKDLNKLISAGVSQVKFVDRSFNCNKERTKEIFNFLININPNINFHFEINADLLDEELLQILSRASIGLFQFEIGVQSTNEDTIRAISRKMDLEKLQNIVCTINSYKNIHLHLDQIAGLPNEDYKTFGESFNDIYSLNPQMLQLGFLKLLRGSGLRNMAQQYNIVYNDYAPYEVISTNHISFEEILKLKDIEDCLERYYNSGRFQKSLDYIVKNLVSSAFQFYEKFSTYWRNNNLFNVSHSSKNLYTILLNYIHLEYKEYTEILSELIKYDYLSNNHSYSLPENVARNGIDIKENVFEFLKIEDNIQKYLPKYIGVPAKQIVKNVHIEIFNINVLSDNFEQKNTAILFDYDVSNNAFKKCNAYNITDEFN